MDEKKIEEIIAVYGLSRPDAIRFLKETEEEREEKYQLILDYMYS